MNVICLVDSATVGLVLQEEHALKPLLGTSSQRLTSYDWKVKMQEAYRAQLFVQVGKTRFSRVLAITELLTKSVSSILEQ